MCELTKGVSVAVSGCFVRISRLDGSASIFRKNPVHEKIWELGLWSTESIVVVRVVSVETASSLNWHC